MREPTSARRREASVGSEAVMRDVVTCEDKMLVTERNYEKRTHVVKNHWECQLSCGH